MLGMTKEAELPRVEIKDQGHRNGVPGPASLCSKVQITLTGLSIGPSYSEPCIRSGSKQEVDSWHTDLLSSFKMRSSAILRKRASC